MQKSIFATILSILLIGNLFAQSPKNVDEATRFRGNQEVSTIQANNINTTFTQSEVSGNLLQNRSNAQLEELGSRYAWGKSNAQLEELGSR
ncbi:MAG: hypothetical protein ABI550_04575, partial [Ignavibacteriaceae bacterium]